MSVGEEELMKAVRERRALERREQQRVAAERRAAARAAERGRMEILRERVKERGPRGLAQYVREITGDGAELVDVLRGIVMDEGESARDRTKAAEVLMDRAYGRAVQVVAEVEGGGVKELEGASVEALEGLWGALRRRIEGKVEVEVKEEGRVPEDEKESRWREELKERGKVAEERRRRAEEVERGRVRAADAAVWEGEGRGEGRKGS